ncbi:MAG TPA: metalloregulator ArsR/SmtB family transcription factor [Patescibacteria group bacterium]|nr:metalloregulator ArsR/SmtB family transcription factor [Patescibacteria group bacterium]
MDVYQALADQNRRKIIELIALKGELTASEISDKFKVTPPAISQHLKVLREAHLVDMEKRAQMRIYTINTNSLDEIEEWAAKMKQLWGGRFDKLDKVLKELKSK